MHRIALLLLLLASGLPAQEPGADASAASAIARRDAARDSYAQLALEERYDEALAMANQLVDLSRQIYGDDSLDLASPLTTLGLAQFNKGDLAGAEQTLKAAVALVERKDGLVSPALGAPLTGLGDVYVRAGLFAQAVQAYGRALRVNHVESGFYNLDQTRILDGLSEAYLGLSKMPQANAQQRVQVAIQERRLGDDNPELAAAYYKLGKWYNRTGQYAEAREAYQYARLIIRETSGESDPSMVDSMLGEAQAWENEGAIPNAAAALKRALQLLDEQPQKDRAKHAEVLVALGDLYSLTRQFRSAGQRYSQAWQELSGDDPLLEQRDRYFAEPSRISGPRLPEIVDASGDPLAPGRELAGGLTDGIVLATMTVDATGEAIDASILESDPPGLLDKRVLRVLGATAFRPRLVDGAPVATENVHFRHEYKYSGTPAAAPSKTTPPPAEDGKRIDYPGAGEDDGAGKP